MTINGASNSQATSQDHVNAVSQHAGPRDGRLTALKMLLVEACRFQRPPDRRRNVVLVLHQVEQLWAMMQGTPDQKYEFLSARLQALFLWDRTTEHVNRDLLCPPQSLLAQFQEQHAQRLRSLPQGQLFFSPTSTARSAETVVVEQ